MSKKPPSDPESPRRPSKARSASRRPRKRADQREAQAPQVQELPGAGPGDPQDDPKKHPFTPEILDRTVIAIPLLDRMRRDQEQGKPDEVYDIIIDLNLEYCGGREQGRRDVLRLIRDVLSDLNRSPRDQGVDEGKSQFSPQYLFGKLDRAVIEEVVRRNQKDRPIYRIWPDFPVRPLISRSVSTVKADAARISFSANGQDIVWAVLDSGIQADHRHFREHDNLTLERPLRHRDFTRLQPAPPDDASDDQKLELRRQTEEASESEALTDLYGHGTHVAGIIAGEIPEKGKRKKPESTVTAGAAVAAETPGAAVADGAPAAAPEDAPILTVTRLRDETGEVRYLPRELDSISGVAPRCKLLSLKVLDAKGDGLASSLIAAIAYIQELNGNGRRIRVHGVNMSVGYEFEPEWFACGQSPLCVEVDRLVRSGVVVVVAAGNTGYGWTQSQAKGAVRSGLALTINDPGNAELAITVGSTHRDMPHIYGVSYFSSKGPTGDGRLKPDLVAPGEKILSCGAGNLLEKVRKKMDGGEGFEYIEDSGTSMAAPHVSGVIAAFLSVRREFIDRPEQVKEIFLSTATDLRRDRYFQGSGLVDLMRAIQSI